MAFISLTVPQVPLVLLEAVCVSTPPFDCLDQANAPMTITGIVLMGHQEKPLMLTPRIDYQLLYQGMKNSCVAVWCGTGTNRCGSHSLLSKKKTRSRNMIKRHQPSEVDKVNFIHNRNILKGRTAVLTILVILALLVVCPYVTLLCIHCKQARRNRNDHVQLLESTNGESESYECATGGTVETNDEQEKLPEAQLITDEPRITGTPMEDDKVMACMKAPTAKTFCFSSTQTDSTNVKSTETQTDHKVSEAEYNGRKGERETREITNKSEPSSLTAGASLKDTKVITSMKEPISKTFCVSSTQVDHTNVESSGTQTDHEMTEAECSSREDDTRAGESDDKTGRET